MKINVCLAAILSAALALSASAAAKKPAPTEPTVPPVKKEEPKKTSYTLSGEVAAVTASSLTLKAVDSLPAKKFAFTENTKILNGDKPCNLSEIKVGKKIGALARKISKGDDQLLTVNVNGKEPVEKTEEKKTDKKSTEPKPKPKPKKKPATDQ